ncbi:interleukin-12 receptor subunit beta-2-like isoform X1 [Scyliorhinus canicula]|uniref:interleukin-12 receptor subunit beta-2-like isoform X1 n=2 Tax=Scyliorhinus canicula TaxID=7830 RepID=UPI0018F2BB62|nr:interleukin-12 receptor subunit beta-2-like isoform X1 [Scyliorhinus canicula]XP_038640930.1 interleukin-12 receptor subunit beta-2-like isoform X1 [Scyliorhinus canicula]
MVYEVLLIAVVLIRQVKQTDPPQDLFCFRLDKNSAINCSWSACEDPQTPTEYTFCIQEKDGTDLTQTPTLSLSLTMDRKRFTAGTTYVAWVKTNRTQREECLSRLEFTIDDIVKPLPPAKVSGEPLQHDPKAIGIWWKNPTNLDQLINLQFELQFRAAGNLDWTKISHDEIGIHVTNYELEDLQPFTLYEFRVKCAREQETNRRLWSDWSAVARVRTWEDTPVGFLDLWFVEQLTTLGGLKSIMVIWKPLEEHQARGIIQRYSVNYLDGEMMKNTSTDICCNISLPRSTSLVNVTAHNSIGATQPAKLNLIPDHPAPFNVTVYSANRSVLVSWEPPANTTPDGFVVEWNRMNSQYVPDWKKISAATAYVTWIDGVLYPLLPYKISVYAQYQGGLGGPVSTLVYAEEGVPLAGPAILILNMSHSGVTLQWKMLPLEKRQGFVRYYTLYYVKKPGGDDKHKALDISYTVDRYTLLNLEPDSSYRIWMTASTIVGEGERGPHINFKTQGSQILFWMAAVLLSCSVLVGLIGLLFCTYCEQRIQSCGAFYLPEWCCQKIPDPRNSRVTGHSPKDNYIPNQPYLLDEPVPAAVEEIENENFEAPSINRNNSILETDREPSMEDQHCTTIKTPESQTPSPGVEKPPEASRFLGESHVDQTPSSTRLLGGGAPFISGYEKHFMPSEEELLNNEWLLEN